jgi:hypothetical protein
MESGAHFDAERRYGILDRTRTANRAGGAVERREEAITCRVHFASAESHEFFAYDVVMSFQQVVPPAVAH